MSQNKISRRNLLQASAGIWLAGGIQPTSLWAQDNPKPPTLDKDLIFRTTDPRNAEPELAKLVKSWITPTELFYVRSHAPNPVIDPQQFRLSVEGMVRRPVTFSLDELKQFPQKTATATLTCAGNRRSEYNGPEFANKPEVGGVQWEAGTIGNATWGGTLLADVLKRAEVTDGAKHIWFEGLDQIPKDGNVIAFGGSIPIEKAMLAEGNGATLLAHAMNESVLSPDHGYPLRAVVPGYIGARSVKWLGKIVVSDRPSPNHYVATAYKIVTQTDPLDWSEAGPIYRFPINAAICTPAPNAQMAAGKIQLTGYALASGRDGSKIRDLRISADNGKSWTRGQLTGMDQDYCWQLWSAGVSVNAETTELILRATDTAGDFMPARIPWNAKGYLRNSWYRQPIKVG